jgi:hypothetical protein
MASPSTTFLPIESCRVYKERAEGPLDVHLCIKWPKERHGRGATSLSRAALLSVCGRFGIVKDMIIISGANTAFATFADAEGAAAVASALRENASTQAFFRGTEFTVTPAVVVTGDGDGFSSAADLFKALQAPQPVEDVTGASY